jgi:hypothetical protein
MRVGRARVLTDIARSAKCGSRVEAPFWAARCVVEAVLTTVLSVAGTIGKPVGFVTFG